MMINCNNYNNIIIKLESKIKLTCKAPVCRIYKEQRRTQL